MLDKVQEYLLSEISRLDDADKKNSYDVSQSKQSINQLNYDVTNTKEDIDILHNTIRSVVSVGADVIPHDNNRSWAVVCIEGNYNVVKFVDLHGADYRRILDFLKQYEGSRMVIDAPNPRYFESMFKF